ncbi:hypothetical protein BGX27_001275 [Mortierella sp. AM989]|nr:hypothetical protein BGX27_001275 [Mortierella sp. AM989]
MSNTNDHFVTESTGLLEHHPDTTTTTAKKESLEHRAPTWYWPWQPNYWAAVVAIFLIGLISGPTVSLIAPFLKELFCERGITTLFPIHNSTSILMRDIPNNEDGHCDSAEYSAAIAKFFGMSTSLAAVMTTLTVRFWSALGDRIGRKRVMQICVSGQVVSVSLCVLVRLNKDMSLYFLMVGDAIEGATGSALAYTALTHAYAADVTLPEERTIVFGRLLAGLYTGVALG